MTLTGRDIVCISSIDWDFIWQGHQEIMSRLAKNGNRVLFIENTGTRAPGRRDLVRILRRLARWVFSLGGFRRQADNLFVYSPLALPMLASAWARRLNHVLLVGPLRRWLASARFNRPILWSYLPTRTALDVIDAVPHDLLIYYCVADFESHSADAYETSRAERELVERADYVFATPALADKLRSGAKTRVFANGVDMELFDRYSRGERATAPTDIAGVKSPVIGYIGGIHRYVDVKLLRAVAERRPDWSLVLVGPRQEAAAELEGLPNIHCLGAKSHAELPAYIDRFSVGLIPYVLAPFTMTVCPSKLNEYHALGKPIVSTPLPEVLTFNKRSGGLVAIASGTEEFIVAIERALNDAGGEHATRRRESARREGWAQKVEEISGFVSQALERREEVAR
jgi:glycosyltransferase involved in cell wall biosynthesis